jgi:hypothetical protein
MSAMASTHRRLGAQEVLGLGEIAVFVASIGLVTATLLLWLEARRLRTEANIVVWAAPWELADGRYIAILLQNAGPVIGREVNLSLRLMRSVDPQKDILKEPLNDVGFCRTIP